MDTNSIITFTDGASRGNPGPGGWGAVIVYPSKVERLHVVELGDREARTTNNRMELKAAIEALQFISTLNPKPSTLLLYSDSSYLINGITKWISKWKKNNWMGTTKRGVFNRGLWEKLDKLASEFNLEWVYVGGHVGIIGNERANEIASSFAENRKIALFQGPLQGYFLKNILDLKIDEELGARKKFLADRSRAQAYSYLSNVGGEIRIHKSWAECEKRVKGKSSARFRKALSADEEASIIRAWQNG